MSNDDFNKIERPTNNPTEKENEFNHFAIIKTTAYLMNRTGELSDDEFSLIIKGINFQVETIEEMGKETLVDQLLAQYNPTSIPELKAVYQDISRQLMRDEKVQQELVIKTRRLQEKMLWNLEG
jgi:hypothetical protein